jgi:hypothetical protein
MSYCDLAMLVGRVALHTSISVPSTSMQDRKIANGA